MPKKGCLFGCLPLLLLLAGAGLVGYRMAAWTPPPAARPAPPTPGQAQAARQKIQRLEAQFRGTPTAAARRSNGERAPSPGARPFRLELTAADLNALWFANPQAREQVARAGFRDPRLALENGVVDLSGYAHALGREVYVQLAGAPAVTPEGWLGLRIEAIRVGQLPAPARLRETLATQLQRPLRDWSRRLGSRLDRAGVFGDRLVLEGTAAPR